MKVMKLYLITYITSLVPFLIIDGAWLATMAKRFYGFHLGSLMSPSPNITVGIIFYLLYALGPALLIVVPAYRNEMSIFKVFGYGMVLGLVAYGTYDLTNQATLRDWPLVITIVDMTWGAFLSGTVSVISLVLTRWFL
jgi:uncharacterized membrane protein